MNLTVTAEHGLFMQNMRTGCAAAPCSFGLVVVVACLAPSPSPLVSWSFPVVAARHSPPLAFVCAPTCCDFCHVALVVTPNPRVVAAASQG